MRVRRVRVPGVPADFRVPVGWPTPVDRWLRDNAFWQPPPGWTPRPALRPAPKHWQYWSPNPAWRTAAAPVFRSIRPWAQAASALGTVWLLLLLVALLVGLPLVAITIGGMAAVGAVACLVVYAILRSRLVRRVMAEAAIVAERERRERMMLEYQRYLRAVS